MAGGCKCPRPGQCDYLGKRMVGRLWQICQGQTDQDPKKFRDKILSKSTSPGPGTGLSRVIKTVTGGKVSSSDCGGCRERELGMNGMYNRAKRRIREAFYGPDPTDLEKDVTIVCTMFRRPKLMRRFYDSVREKYPKIQIICVDNGDQPPDLPSDKNLHYIKLDFDCGMSKCRNLGVKRAATPYVVICEEDFVFNDETSLEKWLEVLETDNRIGLIGGALDWADKKWEYARDFRKFRGTLYSEESKGEWHTSPEGTRYQICDMVFNFFMAHRQVLEQLQWDEQLKLREHIDFFARWKTHLATEWLVAYTEDVCAYHWREGESDELAYRKFRHRSHLPWYNNYLKERFGFETLDAMPAAHARGQGPVRPPIVVMGLGHSGTRLLAKMLHTAGWNGLEIDGWGENPDMRELNDRIVREGISETPPGNCKVRADMRHFLRTARHPWMVKDPRFVKTLPYWRQEMRFHKPVLVWITRNMDDLRESYRRRGENPDYSRGLTMEGNLEKYHQYFVEWPWRKIRLSYEQLCAAAAEYDPNWNEHRNELDPDFSATA